MDDLELWKIKRLIKNLQDARGNGTSMISLVIPPKDQISRVSKMLTDEYGTASNIKSRVNRLSVLGAITSAQQRLKLYNRVPENGLVVYVGTVITAEGKEKKMTIDFEPCKPINTSLYLCDNRFHTEPLGELLENSDCYGFLIMDGNGALFGTVAGNTREILQELNVDLPKQHGRGGQSALRFSRLRDEARHNYLRKVAELATQHFITDNLPNVKGLVLAGSAGFKNDLYSSDLFDKRLEEIVIKIIDVAYGSNKGFSDAIELASDVLSNVRFVQEAKLISQYFEAIALDTGKYCFGVKDTMTALEMGAVETLIVWEDLDILYPKRDSEESAQIPETDQENLLEWLVQNYNKFGARLEVISDKSQEGSQFVQGFGGIGALLRYQVDFALLNADEQEEEPDSDEDLLNDDFLDELDGFL